MKYVIGIDEVGRGALAEPVVVAAALLRSASRSFRGQARELGKLRDSKKLSPKQREAWFAYFKDHPDISYAVAFVYPRQIEKRNISGAANLAARRAFQKVSCRSPRKTRYCYVFLDGGLFLGSRKLQPTYVKTVIKGDEKIPAVSIASIIAKVIRDRAMLRLGKLYPGYGLEFHKGYGTLAHRKALKKQGSSDIHRKTFLGSI